jgi:hypothetical protein
VTTGDDAPVANTVNSLLMHAGTIDDNPYSVVDRRLVVAGSMSRPGVPNRWGSTAVHPMSATLRAKSATWGVMPGISAITITAGPEPVAEDRATDVVVGEEVALEVAEIVVGHRQTVSVPSGERRERRTGPILLT